MGDSWVNWWQSKEHTGPSIRSPIAIILILQRSPVKCTYYRKKTLNFTKNRHELRSHSVFSFGLRNSETAHWLRVSTWNEVSGSIPCIPQEGPQFCLCLIDWDDSVFVSAILSLTHRIYREQSVKCTYYRKKTLDSPGESPGGIWLFASWDSRWESQWDRDEIEPGSR
jgi:hypothetical protein